MEILKMEQGVFEQLEAYKGYLFVQRRQSHPLKVNFKTSKHTP